MLVAAAWYHIILAVIYAGMATFLMLIVLLQRGKGVGLAGAFGGAGGQTVFGSKTGDILTWATVVVAGVFMLLTIGLNYVFVPLKAGLQPVITAPPSAAAPAPVDAGAEEIPMTPVETPAPTPAATPEAAQPAATPPTDAAPAETPAADAPAEAPPTESTAEPAPAGEPPPASGQTP
jgi:preprotein translocase subunit SecG